MEIAVTQDLERMRKPELSAFLSAPSAISREENFGTGPWSSEERLRLLTELRSAPTPPTLYTIHSAQDLIASTPWRTPVRVYTPSEPKSGRALPLVVYFHGGGWVYGDLETNDSICRSLANNADAVVVNVDYGLAPERAYPETVDEVVAATRWAVENAAKWGADGEQVAIAGSSSGGNLAAAVVLDEKSNDRSFAAQLLIYPALDATMSGDSHRENASGNLLSEAEMSFYWQMYGGDNEPREHPLLSPLHATDLEGIPPTLIVTAGFDVLRDDGIAYHERLLSAGVAARHLHYHGQIHGFLSLSSISSDPGHCLTEAGTWLTTIFSEDLG